MPNTIEKPLVPCRDATSWRSQFAKPQGWRGWIVGEVMAIKNRQRSLWVLSLLDLRPDARVLEIGFGSGADIHRAAKRVPKGLFAGIDHSEVMLRQATHRNKSAIKQGRVQLQLASVSSLPYQPDTFDVVFSINVAQFWASPVNTAAEIRRVLKPGGLVVLAIQPRNKGANEQTASDTAETLFRTLTAAGFASVRQDRKPMKPVSTVCARGRK